MNLEPYSYRSSEDEVYRAVCVLHYSMVGKEDNVLLLEAINQKWGLQMLASQPVHVKIVIHHVGLAKHSLLRGVERVNQCIYRLQDLARQPLRYGLMFGNVLGYHRLRVDAGRTTLFRLAVRAGCKSWIQIDIYVARPPLLIDALPRILRHWKVVEVRSLRQSLDESECWYYNNDHWGTKEHWLAYPTRMN